MDVGETKLTRVEGSTRCVWVWASVVWVWYGSGMGGRYGGSDV